MSSTTDPAKPTVFIVDDEADMRESLRWLLGSIGLTSRAFASAGDFLANYTADQPGCLLLDVRMPGMSGLELQMKLAEDKILLPVIIITGHADVPMAVAALKAGAFDFIEKPFNDQLLLDRVQQAIDHDTQRRQHDSSRAAVQARADRLSRREQEVMRLVITGLSNKQIAAELGLSPKTVEVHRSHVMQKMEAHSVAELVRFSYQLDRNCCSIPA